MFAVPLGLFAVSLPDELRPRAFGINAAMWGVSALIGPALGAVLTATVGWRWVFWINLPLIAIVAWSARARAARPGRPEPERSGERARFNIAGPVLLGLVVAVLLALTKHWLPPLLLAPLALVPAAAFFVHERRTAPAGLHAHRQLDRRQRRRLRGRASRSWAPRRTCRCSSRSASRTDDVPGVGRGRAAPLHARLDGRVDGRGAHRIAAAEPDRCSGRR